MLQEERLDRAAQRFAPKPRAPKAAPPPPDEVRDRRIKSLETRVKNLLQERAATKQHYEAELRRTGGMNFRTRSVVMKCLHPDQRTNASEADKDEACRLFTAWASDSNKAARSKPGR